MLPFRQQGCVFCISASEYMCVCACMYVYMDTLEHIHILQACMYAYICIQVCTCGYMFTYDMYMFMHAYCCMLV